MYLHLGCDAVILQNDVVGIFDLDATTVSARTRDYLRGAQERGEVLDVGGDLPKSFVLIQHPASRQNLVYLSPLGTGTLQKRCQTPFS
jgi:hypothetical protein